MPLRGGFVHQCGSQGFALQSLTSGGGTDADAGRAFGLARTFFGGEVFQFFN